MDEVVIINAADVKPAPKVVTIKGKYFVWKHNLNSSPYEFHVDRCQNSEQVLSWIHHMTEKTWVTTSHIYQFVNLCVARGIKIDWNA